MDEVRVVVVAADAWSRETLAALVGAADGVRLVGQTAPDARLESVLRLLRPHVALWDAPPANGGADQFAATAAGVPAVALVADAESGRRALRQGARGVLLRPAAEERIADALRAASRGLFVLDPALAALLPRSRAVGADTPVEPLTARELEVLQLLSEGDSNRRIAERLGIAENTVRFHVNAILGKLAASNRTEALVKAARLGLVLL